MNKNHDTALRAVIATTIDTSAAHFTTALRERLNQMGYDVVTATSRTGTHYDQIPNAYEIPMSRDIDLLADLVSLIRWTRFMLQHKPQTLITLTPKSSLLSLAAAYLTRVPRRVYLIVGLPLETQTGAKRTVLKCVERLAAALANEVVANSPSLAREYKRQTGTRQEVRAIRPGSDHGVNFAHFNSREPAPAHLDPQDRSQLHVLFIGRVTKDKGMRELIDALATPELKRRTKLVVVGSADEADSQSLLEHLAQTLPDAHYENFSDDIRPYLTWAHILVLPSHREGFPNVVLEAACAKVPAVTTTATGCVDSVIHDSTGLLVPPQSAQALADAIYKFIDEPTLAPELGANAQARAQTQFAPDQIITQLLKGHRGTL